LFWGTEGDCPESICCAPLHAQSFLEFQALTSGVTADRDVPGKSKKLIGMQAVQRGICKKKRENRKTGGGIKTPGSPRKKAPLATVGQAKWRAVQ